MLLVFFPKGQVEELSIESAHILLPVAHYFDLYHFENICSKLIEDQLTVSNVCETFDQHYYMDNALTKKCIKMMVQYTPKLLADGSLWRMQMPALDKIMKNDDLYILSESNLLAPLVDWADKQCADAKIEPTADNRRSIINDRLYYIRFAAMPVDVFSDCLLIVGRGFFTKEEIADILLCISLGGEKLPSLTQNYKRFDDTPRLRANNRRLVVNNEANARKRGPLPDVDGVIIKQHNLADYNVLGFEIEYQVDKITDSNAAELEFIQNDFVVFLTEPLPFINKECTFRMYTSKKDSNCIYKKGSIINDNNIFIDTYTLISVLYVSK